MNVHRGDIYYADLSPVVGSEQGGVRPVLIVQNDVGNRFSPTVIAAAITSQRDKAKLPTHIQLDSGGSGLIKDSIVLLEQIRTLDKRRLKEHMGRLDERSMMRIDEALQISFGLTGKNGTTYSIYVVPPPFSRCRKRGLFCNLCRFYTPPPIVPYRPFVTVTCIFMRFCHILRKPVPMLVQDCARFRLTAVHIRCIISA